MTRTIEQLQSPSAARLWCEQARRAGKSIGFVPTMGALHAGHLGLVRRARLANDYVVVSIFVNPLQFGQQADLDGYPRDFQSDVELLDQVGCDMVFTGTLLGEGGFFPEATVREDIREVAPGASALGLEGDFRIGHFEGVATIVRRLFEVTSPTRAYLGEKDYQQTLVVRDLASRLGAAGPEIIICEIAREESGVARSSRNARLSGDGFLQASALSRALSEGCRLWRAEGERDPAALETCIKAALEGPRDGIESSALQIDYVAVRDPDLWTPERPAALASKAVALVAAEVEGVRLIDNMRLDVACEQQPLKLALRDSECAAVLAQAPAKINPWLEVLAKREDGFHEVDLTMLCIDLIDHLRVSWIAPESSGIDNATPQIQLRVTGPAATLDVPLDAGNSVWRAAQLALDAHPGTLPAGGLSIELYKCIPSRAGLGGGSSDAAAALCATVRLLSLVGNGAGELDGADAQVHALAEIGSDCAFFLAATETGFGRCTGRGERVEALRGGTANLRSLQLVVPSVECGTGAVYGGLQLQGSPRTYSASSNFNRLLEPALTAFPELSSLREELAKDGQGEWEMSGSGSSLYREFAAPIWFDLEHAVVPKVEGARYLGCHRPTGFGARVIAEVCAPDRIPAEIGEEFA
jgi:pantoate--beta-alanine ligase